MLPPCFPPNRVVPLLFLYSIVACFRRAEHRLSIPPSSGVTGQITYNGYKLNEFVPRKTSAYISENDVHLGEMTLKETLDFSARCQGVGTRYDLLAELARREKEAGRFPEAELDLFMEILGLNICKDTIVGDEMQRGVSGGQKKRVM
ncbi:hypothetical protein RJT34_05851 [Clitoria ternatea]|uniref:ABC transporter domain-containing protein n=1 Tax=Clitoria ternatea TaxID=43366 RepID=A0AAN9PTZ0_CLITE